MNSSISKKNLCKVLIFIIQIYYGTTSQCKSASLIESCLNENELQSYKDQIDICDNIINKNKKGDKDIISTGSHYYKQETYEKELFAIEEKIRVNSKNAYAYNRRGNIRWLKGDYDKAIDDYNEAILLNPEYVFAYFNRGNTWREKKEYNKAIADYNIAIKLDPKYTSAYNHRGMTYHDKKDYDRAIADYTSVINLKQNSASAYSNRGNSYWQKGDLRRALSDLNKAIKIDPKFALAYNNRALVFDEMNEYDKAVNDYNEMIRLDPQYADAYNNRAKFWYERGDYDRSLQDYNRAIELGPNNPYYYIGRARVLRDQGYYDRALSDFDKAKKLDQKMLHSEYFYTNLGLLWEMKGEYEKALDAYDRLLAINPNYKPVTILRLDVLKKLSSHIKDKDTNQIVNVESKSNMMVKKSIQGIGANIIRSSEKQYKHSILSSKNNRDHEVTDSLTNTYVTNNTEANKKLIEIQHDFLLTDNNPINPFHRIKEANRITIPRSEAQATQMRERTIFLKNEETVSTVLLNMGVPLARVAAVASAILSSQIQNISSGHRLQLLFADFDGSGKNLQLARVMIFKKNEIILTLAATDDGRFIVAPYEQSSCQQ